MRLDARLDKLEEKATRVLRCAWCRYSLAPIVQPSGGKAAAGPPPEYVPRVCSVCGTAYVQGIPAGTSPRERESFLLWYHKYEGETYRDERAYAAREWWTFRWQREGVMRQKKAAPATYQNNGREKLSAAARKAQELQEEAFAVVEAAKARERKLYGPRSFPLVERLLPLREDLPDFAHSYDGDQPRSIAERKALQLLAFARCMAECEKVLWGEVEPDTAREIEQRASEAETLAEARRREKRERAEREQLERAERERERLERLRGTSGAAGRAAPTAEPIRPAQEPPVPRFRAPDAPTPRSLDPTGAHVPEPARMVTFPDPADPSKRIIVGRSIGPETYDPNHPDAVQFQRSSNSEDLPDHERYYRGEYYDGDPRY